MTKATYSTKAKADLQYIRAVSPYLRCDKCGLYLGIAHCIRYALFKKRWSTYNVPCKSCSHINSRVKGDLSSELNTRWVD